ncbi:hypothetical protein RUM43_007713 [Polyplax serrata]|uniref:Uncharacterized protein n=1 Tax=Polyplax serrata TaxID=468196 RepID=A0AAN8P933_POLSC
MKLRYKDFQFAWGYSRGPGPKSSALSTCILPTNLRNSEGEVEGRGVTTWETKKLNFLRSAGGGSKQYLCCMHMVYLKECQSVSRDCRQRCERHGENVKGKNASVGVRVRAKKD